MALRATPASVSSAEIVRQFGRWQDHAANEPVLVTHHGRERVMLISIALYRSLVQTARNEGQGSAVGDDKSVEQLTENMSLGFLAFRADMTVTMINSAASSFLKLPRDTIIGRKLPERLPGVDETLGYISLMRAASSGSISTFEMPSFAYQGRWLLFRTFPFGDGAACLFRDITDEQEARRDGDSKTAAMAAMAAHGGIGRARLSTRGTFVELDAAFAGFAGFEPEGLARVRLTDILVTRDRARATDAVEEVLQGGTARAFELSLLTRTGEERPVRIGLAPQRDQGGVSGAVVVMTDRTDQPV